MAVLKFGDFQVKCSTTYPSNKLFCMTVSEIVKYKDLA